MLLKHKNKQGQRRKNNFFKNKRDAIFLNKIIYFFSFFKFKS